LGPSERRRLDYLGPVATLMMDRALAAAWRHHDDTGLILPLTVRDIQAVVFFKENGPTTGASACARKAR
jgi:hypothetical protein